MWAICCALAGCTGPSGPARWGRRSFSAPTGWSTWGVRRRSHRRWWLKMFQSFNQNLKNSWRKSYHQPSEYPSNRATTFPGVCRWRPGVATECWPEPWGLATVHRCRSGWKNVGVIHRKLSCNIMFLPNKCAARLCRCPPRFPSHFLLSHLHRRKFVPDGQLCKKRNEINLSCDLCKKYQLEIEFIFFYMELLESKK